MFAINVNGYISYKAYSTRLIRLVLYYMVKYRPISAQYIPHVALSVYNVNKPTLAVCMRSCTNE